MKLFLPVFLVAAALAAGADAAMLPGAPSDVMCFRRSMKYNYCFPILKSDTYQDMAAKEASCAAKNPGGGPDSWSTQTECCKVHGGCGYSGGPGGRECWAPDFSAKKCVKHSLADEGGADRCNSGLAGGFQLQTICETESFGGASVSNKMAPVEPAKPADKMAPMPGMSDKMAPVKPQPKPAQVIEIKYSGRSNADLGGDVDIPSGGKTYTQVCGGVTNIIVACNQNKACVAFTIESKDIGNPRACGYLKKAGGKVSARQAWTVFVRQ